MKTGAPHPFAAWFLDVWLLVSLTLLVTDAVAAPWVILLVATAYHALWSASARFLTFGESALGRVLVDGRKVWSNPYATSRTLLYGCAVYGLFMGVRVGSASLTVPVELMTIAIAGGSMILLGRGHQWALLGIVAYRAIARTATMWPFQLDPFDNFIVRVLVFHGETVLFAVVCVAVAHHYGVAPAAAGAPKAAALPPHS